MSLANNTATLEDILATVNALPNASGGITPAGTVTITENGTYDVTNYASAEIDVESSGGDTSIEDGLITRTITTYTNNRITTIGERAFYGFSSLTSVSFYNVQTVGADAFNGCSGLEIADFKRLGYTGASIEANAFNGCTNLRALILRAETAAPVSLKGTGALSNTAIANGTGYIYAPAYTITYFKSDTNWSAYAAQFRALEDYTVNGTISGKLDESKI